MTTTQINKLTQEDINKANKEQLKTWLMEAIEQLNTKKDQKSNKKYLVLAILERGEPIEILDISNELNLSTKCVSTYLCYLRRDGHRIMTDDKGRKFLA